MNKKDRRFKKSLIYSQCGKTVEEELTYDKFVECLKSNFEFFLTYKNYTIDIAYHFENDVKIYECSVNGYGINAQYAEFESIDELLENFKLEEKLLFEIWDDLEN